MTSNSGIQFGWRWLAAALLAVLLTSGLALMPQPAAAEGPPAQTASVAPQSQIFNDDLVVEDGQVFSGDVVVYSGDATVKDGGKILGNLTVYSGDIEVDAGGLIEGSVTSWSGDLQVDGRVGGSVTMMNGDVELGDRAAVGGDISVVKGNIQQRAGAAVGGSLLRGPQLQFSAPPLFVGAPNAPVAPVEPETWAERLFGFMGKVLLALVMFALVVGGAVAVAGLRPHWVASVHETLRQQVALSFAVGLMVNVLASAFIGLLFITVCLRPPGLLLGLLLAAANVVGLAAVGHEIGGRLSPKMGGNWQEWSLVGLGVAVPTGIIMLLWLFGWCFTFFAWLGALIVGSFGLGAIVVRMLGLGNRAPQQSPAPVAPVTAPAPAEPAPTAAESAPAAQEAAAPEREAMRTVTAVAPAENVTESAPPIAGTAAAPAADFTQITGIGPKLSQKLLDAGVHTYADLGARSAAEVAQILGWAEDRVVRVQIIEQAQRLAAGG